MMVGNGFLILNDGWVCSPIGVVMVICSLIKVVMMMVVGPERERETVKKIIKNSKIMNILLNKCVE